MRDKPVLLAALLFASFPLLFLSPVIADTADEVRAKALGVLKSDAPAEQKWAACRELGRVGGKDCVNLLAAMLEDKQLSHWARYALEPMPDKAVDEVLRAAVDKVKGKLLCGVISSIGARRDVAAVPLLGKQLSSSDCDVVRTTAIALGRIGTAAAGRAMLDALRDAKRDDVSLICDGLLLCGANLAAHGQQGKANELYGGMLKQNLPARLRGAALRGAVLCDPSAGMRQLSKMLRDSDLGAFTMGLHVAAEMKDKAVTEVLVSEIGKLPADRFVPVIKILGQRADKAALPLLLELAKKGEKVVRLEAILSLAEIGDARAVPVLVELIKDPDHGISLAAATAVAGLPGPEVDSAVVRILEKPDPALRLKMLEIAGQRRIASAMPAVRTATSDADRSIRAAAVKSYGELAGAEGIPALIDMLLRSSDVNDTGLCERALGAVCPMASDRDACARKLIDALSRATPAVKAALLRTLRVAGGPDALKAVRAAADDANKDVHTTAVRVLGEWGSAEAAPALLELAKSSSQPVDRILALRGYLGIALQRNVAAQDKLAICRQAAPLIGRAEEKRMLLGSLGSLARVESLDLIVPYLDDPAIRREAVTTIMAIAEKRRGKQHAAVAKAALEKVVQVGADDPASAKRAGVLLKQIANEK